LCKQKTGEKEEKKQKSFINNSRQSLKKTINSNWKPTLFSLLFHHISSLLFAQERQRGFLSEISKATLPPRATP
jgi:hypothetical protein